jgi:hypothetical protein
MPIENDRWKERLLSFGVSKHVIKAYDLSYQQDHIRRKTETNRPVA